MRFILRIFATLHAFLAVLFVAGGLVLVAIATRIGWLALERDFDVSAAQTVIEAIGLLAAAVVAFQIAQTIAEEEVVRDAHVSGPTRVRRFLSRFMVVVVVALVIEGLVATFQALHENAERLPHAAALIFATGSLLAAWGLFVRWNRAAEELEPEAMQEAKKEDRKLR